MNGRRAKRERRQVPLDRAGAVLERAYRTGKCPNCKARVESFVTIALPGEPGIGFSCPRCDRTAAAALAQSRAARADRPGRVRLVPAALPYPREDDGTPYCAFCESLAVEWQREPVALVSEYRGERWSTTGLLAVCDVCLSILDDYEALLARTRSVWPAGIDDGPPWVREQTVRVLQEAIQRLRVERC